MFPTLFGSVGSALSSIETVKPKRVMIEEVGGLGKAFSKSDLETGLQMIEHRVMQMRRDDGTQLFCAYAVASVDLATWLNQSRFRYGELANKPARRLRSRSKSQ